jgi:AraC-like DNA-binding protein
MKISFQKKQGNPSLGIVFFWKMTMGAKSPVTIMDHFVPELFYDFFFVRNGKVKYIDPQGNKSALPWQALKTIHTHPIKFMFSTPLVLFGARLSLEFAEAFWEKDIKSNSFMEKNWVDKNTNSLASFASQITETVQKYRTSKTIAPLLSPALEESAWLGGYSPRHKSRLYKSVFGISKKEMWSIQNVHSFLEQTCDFASKSPRIIQHVNPEVFYDQPHLNHAFKKVTGLSPVEYFEQSSILQDNLMSASYNEISGR